MEGLSNPFTKVLQGLSNSFLLLTTTGLSNPFLLLTIVLKDFLFGIWVIKKTYIVIPAGSQEEPYRSIGSIIKNYYHGPFLLNGSWGYLTFFYARPTSHLPSSSNYYILCPIISSKLAALWNNVVVLIHYQNSNDGRGHEIRTSV